MFYQDLKELSTNLSQLFTLENKQPVFSDFLVVTRNKTFECHRAILHARSAYFRGLLRSQMKETTEGKVEIRDISSEVMKNILTYIYTGSLEITRDNAIEILISSQKLLLDQRVLDNISQFVVRHVSLQNVAEVLSLSSRFSFETIHDYCIRFCILNFRELIHESSFLFLSASDLELILAADDLLIDSEQQLLESIIHWAKNRRDFNGQNEDLYQDEKNSPKNLIQKRLARLLPRIRFCEIEQTQLQVLQKQGILTNELFDDIVEFQCLRTQKVNAEEIENFLRKCKSRYSKSNFLAFQPRNCFPDSLVVSIKNTKLVNFLKNSIEDDVFFSQMRLGYSARQHGFFPLAFHEKVDNKGKTLVLMKTVENYIFGGYTEVGWVTDKQKWSTVNANWGWIGDPKAFVFVLKPSVNGEDHTPQKFDIKKGEEKWAILYRDTAGPQFGYDIRITSWDVNSVFDMIYSNLGNNYQLEGSDNPFKQKRKIPDSLEAWKIKEIEVYFI
ncbi:pep-cterm sorting domain-containing protein [Anaeramoeba ignava]|uniref:Pep-cterm sorting domain-containing protein n=1 Tax=Anaeramoeba ignava TaxID=1746090 RepID=A0A9Q0LCH4_ANAIG|nr:pep-cterm sorting domain-containing protein [Anaeramoeba ignava]